jgi:hypothetical protein
MAKGVVSVHLYLRKTSKWLQIIDKNLANQLTNTMAKTSVKLLILLENYRKLQEGKK